eukprot:scaffold17925_cov56-Attheya_sp.AAC.6
MACEKSCGRSRSAASRLSGQTHQTSSGSCLLHHGRHVWIFAVILLTIIQSHTSNAMMIYGSSRSVGEGLRRTTNVDFTGSHCIKRDECSFRCLSSRASFGRMHGSELSMDLCTTSSRADRPSRHTVTMGKGDGKKKRKKKSPGTPDTSAAVPKQPQPQPQRVSTEINVPIRMQLAYAKMRKDAIKRSSPGFRQTNAKRTRFRLSICKYLNIVAYCLSWIIAVDDCFVFVSIFNMVLLAMLYACLAEEEQEIKAVERTKRGQEPDWAVILNNTMSSPLVIVDAYNIIYQWPRLKKWMTKGMMHKAREYLIHDLEELQYLKGWRIECVFDGAGKSTVGPLGDGPGGGSQREKVSKPDQMSNKKVTEHGVRVVYSGVGASADSYIEERCFTAKSITNGETTGSLIVASNDGAIRTIASSAGALCMSSDRFVDELKAARKATLYRIEVAISKHTGQAIRPSKFHGKAGAPTAFRNKLIIEDKRTKKAPHDGEQSIDIIESIKRKSYTPPTMFRNSFVVVDKRNKSKKASNVEDEKAKDFTPRVQNESEEQVDEEKTDGQNQSLGRNSD